GIVRTIASTWPDVILTAMARKVNTMANDPKQNNSVAAAENLLQELKQRAEAAHKNNDVFTMTLMTELIKVTSPIITRAVNRYHREERARINEMARNLRAQSREQKPSNREV